MELNNAGSERDTGTSCSSGRVSAVDTGYNNWAFLKVRAATGPLSHSQIRGLVLLTLLLHYYWLALGLAPRTPSLPLCPENGGGRHP